MLSRTRLALASIALLAATASGCGGGTGADDGSDPDSTHEQMLEYAQCLREHGVDVEDPRPGEGIRIQAQGEPDEQQVREADQACEDLAPPGAAEEPEGAREQMLEVARCMREQGVQDFPDPKPGEGINIDGAIVEDPDFQEAQQICMPDMPAPDVDGGP